jgi:hypothetical protein
MLVLEFIKSYTQFMQGVVFDFIVLKPNSYYFKIIMLGATWFVQLCIHECGH